MQHSKNKEIENLVSELKKYSKVVAVILFGSYARKRIKPLSDIDIAVIIKDMDKKTETEVATYSSKDFDVVPFHRLPLYIQFEVLKHGKLLFLRNKNYFLSVKMQVLREYLDHVHLYERMSKRCARF